MNPNIALSYKPVELDIEGAMQFRENKKRLESQNALAAAEQANQQEKLRNSLALREYAANADFNDPKQAMSLMRYGESGANMLQSLQAGQASSASARKTGGEYANQKTNYYLDVVLPFARENGKDGIIRMLDMMRKDPDLAGSPLVSMPKEFADTNLPDPVRQPVQYAQWEQRMGLGLSEFLKRTTMTAEQQSMATDRAEQRGISRGQLSVARGNLGVARDRLAFDQGKVKTDIPLDEAARQRALGETQAKFETAAPNAISDATQALGLIDQMIGTKPYIDKATGRRVQEKEPHPGFSGAVGFGIGQRYVPGTNAASFQALFDQVQGGAFLQAFETLRGGGAITEKEGAKATAAKNRMSLAQDEKSFIAAAREYQDVLREGIKRAQARLQGGAPTGGANIDALLDKYKD